MNLNNKEMLQMWANVHLGNAPRNIFRWLEKFCNLHGLSLIIEQFDIEDFIYDGGHKELSFASDDSYKLTISKDDFLLYQITHNNKIILAQYFGEDSRINFHEPPAFEKGSLIIVEKDNTIYELLITQINGDKITILLLDNKQFYNVYFLDNHIFMNGSNQENEYNVFLISELEILKPDEYELDFRKTYTME